MFQKNDEDPFNLSLLKRSANWQRGGDAKQNRRRGASKYVRKDLRRWGVKLDYASLSPSAETPVITQRLRHLADGRVAHSFGWDCPSCGSSLPWFKPITLKAINNILDTLPVPKFFYFDRLSPAAITLATWAFSHGACVVFEPSGRGDDRLFQKAMGVVHILKYSEQRFAKQINAIEVSPSIKLEIQTRGENGLTFRTRNQGRLSTWNSINACNLADPKDTAGAGDWYTAGMIYEISKRGLSVDKGLGVKLVKEILTVAEAFAAWACHFEGARGGVYHASRESLKRFIMDTDRKKLSSATTVEKAPILKRDAAICPSCLH